VGALVGVQDEGVQVALVWSCLALLLQLAAGDDLQDVAGHALRVVHGWIHFISSLLRRGCLRNHTDVVNGVILA